jgi:peptidyl-prolyl cis-trans isomerase D
MFDLFRSRDKAVRYLLGGLLGIVALSMVITLIPGFGSSMGTSSDDQVVAEIGKEPLTIRQVQSDMQRLVRDRQMPPELVQVYLPQAVDQMITERAVAYQAQRMGFQVPDTELAATIRSVLPRFFQNGQLVDKNAYEQFLAQQGYTIPEFEDNLRKQILMTRLMNLALEGIVITPEEAKRDYERRNSKLKIAYIGFKADDLKSQVKVSPEELQAYYNNNKEGYREPEKRDLVVLVADQDKIANSIEVPEAQLRQMYETRKDSFRTPERVKVRHILFMTTGKSPEEIAKIKAKAEDVRKQINDKNFADLAKKYSEDPGSKDKGGDLGWVVRGQTVKNFENTAFNQKTGQISDLVTTEYGFHIIETQEKQDAHLQPFDEVKAQLASDAKKAQVTDRVQNGIEQARAALVKTPGDYEQIAKQYNLDVAKADNVAPGGAIGSLPQSADLDTALSGLKPGEVSQVVQIAPTKLAIGEVMKVTPSRLATFAEAEPHIRDNFVNQRAQTLAGERAKQAAEKVKAGEDMQKVAKELGGEYKTPPEFTSEGAVEGLGSASSLGDAFSKPAGTILGPLPVVGQQIVAKVIEKIPADMNAFAAQRDSVILQLKSKKAQERKDLFQDSILTKLIKEGKVKRHNDTLKRLMASYSNR